MALMGRDTLEQDTSVCVSQGLLALKGVTLSDRSSNPTYPVETCADHLPQSFQKFLHLPRD